MKVLLVGGGGREHALAWKLAQSPRLSRLLVAPGNAGTAALGENVPVRADAVDALADLAARERVDLTVVGPEQPLTLGLADRLTARGLAVFGPGRAAAELEGSKVFAKGLFARHGIPTARFAAFEDAVAARGFARELGGRVVVKADGLAAGKGAIVCDGLADAEQAIGDLLERRTLGAAGARIVVEERLEGEEVSVFALTDGERVCPLESAQDHKTVFDGDRGPNTGGMGAYSPPPVVDAALAARLCDTLIRPTVRAMAAEGRPYRGVLYAGVMLTRDGPRMLEYNVRFGDPECQALVVRLAEDLLSLCQVVAEGGGLPARVAWTPGASACVVLTSAGYPGAYATGHPISGLEAAAARPGVTVFHAGTALEGGRVVTAGGRVLGVTATGADVRAAVTTAYAAVGDIHFQGIHFRRDIGHRALGAAG
jgi:phosphoribosylamine--glycine ligase